MSSVELCCPYTFSRACRALALGLAGSGTDAELGQSPARLTPLPPGGFRPP